MVEESSDWIGFKKYANSRITNALSAPKHTSSGKTTCCYCKEARKKQSLHAHKYTDDKIKVSNQNGVNLQWL